MQSEATQFVGTAAANTIGLVIGTIHEDIKELLEIPDEYQAISIVSSRTGTVAQAIAIDDAVKAVNAKLLRFEMAIDAGKQCGQGCLFVLGAENISDARRLVEIALEQIDYWAACIYVNEVGIWNLTSLHAPERFYIRYLVHHLARHLALSVLPQQESALLPLTSA